MTNGWGIYCEIALRWISMNPTDDKSILVQVMAWWRQATSHYLSQCWPRSLSPYGVTRAQWINYKWVNFIENMHNQHLIARFGVSGVNSKTDLCHNSIQTISQLYTNYVLTYHCCAVCHIALYWTISEQDMIYIYPIYVGPWDPALYLCIPVILDHVYMYHLYWTIL